MKDIAELLARILLSFLFIYEAIDAIVSFDKSKATMTAYNITWNQDIILIVIIIVLFVGSLLVLIGYYASIGAILLLMYWIPFTLVVYSFWDDPQEFQRLHTIYFMRNLAIMGGLLLLIANGAGKYSIKRLLYTMRLPK